MSGPLTLPSDPTGSNQAATKHYVDNGLAAKANLVAGVVPTVQLGSGSPDGTLCLKGDSTWGACGTSTNAATIQNVPVDTTVPSDGQVLTYQASAQKYTPKSGSAIGGNPSAGMQVVGNGSSFAAQAKPAIDVRDYGVDCTGSSASDSGLSSAATAGPHAVIPQGCVVRLSTSKSYALTLEFKQGGQLKPDNGVTVTSNTRLPVGADNSCLVADSTQALGLKWGACASGSGGGSFASLTGQPTDNANLAGRAERQGDGCGDRAQYGQRNDRRHEDVLE
jgi:hypothetical protein